MLPLIARIGYAPTYSLPPSSFGHPPCRCCLPACHAAAPTNQHPPPGAELPAYIKLGVPSVPPSSFSFQPFAASELFFDQLPTEKEDEVREAAQEADRGEPAGVAEPLPQLQGAQAPRQRRLLPGADRRGRVPHSPRRRGRQVQRLLPRGGGGVRHQAEGAAGEDPARRRGQAFAGGGGGDGAHPAGGRRLPRRDGAAAQLQQHQLHGARQDPQEVRQAHRRRAPAPRHRGGPAAALLHHRPHLRARQGLRGHDGGRLPALRRRLRRQQGPRGAPGARRRQAEHLPQHRRRAPHHAGGPQRQLHRRPLLAAAHDAAARVRLARTVRPDAAVAAHPHAVIHYLRRSINRRPMSMDYTTTHSTQQINIIAGLN